MYGHERRAECSREIVGRERAASRERTVMFIVIILTRLIYCLPYLMRVYRREKRWDRKRQNGEAERFNEML